MGEVVIHRHAIDHAAHLQPAAHAFKAAERGNRGRGRHAHMPRCGDRRQRIAEVVRAGHRRCDGTEILPGQRELRHARLVHRRLPAVRPVEPLQLRPATFVDHPRERLRFGIGHDPAGGRHDAHQMMKLSLDRRQIGEDVGVVELQVVENRRAWPVMHKLGPLVAERGVVLVRFDHKERRIGQPRRHTKVLRHTANQKARVEPAVFQHPGQQRGRRRLAMRARHAQHPLVSQHMVGQPLRAGHIGRTGIENRFKQGVAARNRIADHIHVRRQRHL